MRPCATAPYGRTYPTQIAIILLLIDNNLNIFDDSHLQTSLLFIDSLSPCIRFTERCYLKHECVLALSYCRHAIYIVDIYIKNYSCSIINY